ncbi:hypothetical protein CC80DRAFT_428416 [Byssothecium circinans]|uniref:GH16 domain-containing protein n=1 Tax=Byssothecium circinans TaxID=147558 RepID=A0A6A5TBX5_9PLEO|nr:hypothetical protein CC80DRAFT_428416 [Byssothecium circinans]
MLFYTLLAGLTFADIGISENAGGAGYNLDRLYDSSDFFDKFNFIDVSCQRFLRNFDLSKLTTPKPTAQSSYLARYINNKVFLGVDNTTVSTTKKRNSIRLESKNTFDNGLLVADFDHLPAKGCGMWPAFWVLNDHGEGYSEIDIVEGANLDAANEISLFTSHQPCALKDNHRGTGRVSSTDCVQSEGEMNGEAPQGRVTHAPENTFGETFNTKDGGVWALQLENDGIKAWHLAREDVPADLRTVTPDPRKWGRPAMDFGPGTCDIAKAWRKLTIVLNITFCGDWAAEESSCATCKKWTGVANCEAFVSAHPEAFDYVYFFVNSVKLFTRV